MGNGMNDGGKGSAPRPYSVNRKTFEENWDAIFGEGSNRSGDHGSGDSGVNVGVFGGGDKTRREAGAKESPEHKPSK